MAKDLVQMNPEWEKRAREWYEWGVELQEQAREFKLDAGEFLRQGHQEEFYKALGYMRFGDFTQAFFNISRETAYQYIRIAENVVKELPEEMCALLTKGDNPLPLKLLAAMHFGQETFTPEVMERLRRMGPEARREELIRLGYDRDRMGGRGPADLLRPRCSRKTHRSERKQIQMLKEKARLEKAEKEELRGEIKRLRELFDAVEDPDKKKLAKMVTALEQRIAELEGEKAEKEAEIASGKEVPGRALRFQGEIIEVCNRFADETYVDTLDGWIAVRREIASAIEYVGDVRGKMAEVLSKRMAEGEIEPFDLEDPEAGRALADSAMTPRSERRQREAG